MCSFHLPVYSLQLHCSTVSDHSLQEGTDAFFAFGRRGGMEVKKVSIFQALPFRFFNAVITASCNIFLLLFEGQSVIRSFFFFSSNLSRCLNYLLQV